MSEDPTKATARPWIAVEGDIWDQRLDEAPGIPLFRADRSHRRYGRPLTDEVREANAALIAKGEAANGAPAETDTRGDHCPVCGYTLADCQWHRDHHLCKGPGPKGWVRRT